MSEVAEPAEDMLPLDGVGQQLKRAREAAGMSIEQIAGVTRIPIRHLQVIETGNFDALPARTYAIGFSRTYARAVGLDEIKIADQLRGQLGDRNDAMEHRPAKFEPGDPTRIPSRGLAWFSAFAVLLLIVGGLAFFRGSIFPGSGPASILPPESTADAPVVAAGAAPRPSIAAATPSGNIVFTAQEDSLWVKFYDAQGTRVMEKQMAKGETYTAPADVAGLQVWTGQPEALSITIGGKIIGTLSQESEIVRDIPVEAKSLVARVAANKAEAQQAAAGTAPQGAASAAPSAVPAAR